MTIHTSPISRLLPLAGAVAAAVLLSACGGSNSNAASGDTAGSNIITAYNSEPQNPLIPGNTNEIGRAHV